jgi:hypothetical protein
MGIAKESEFWATNLILAVTVFLMIAQILHWVRLGFLVGPFRLTHWFGWTGTVYVALAVPTIALLKKRFPTRYQTLLRIHMFGNLLAFMLISLHFASQISRPATSYPELGTGLVLYIAMVLLVGTGILQSFHLPPKIKPQTYRFLHTGSALAFYLIIIVHILHGLGFI